jgi:hypothetical protein
MQFTKKLHDSIRSGKGVTPTLARRSGFESVAALMLTAKHRPGDEQIFLMEFRYLPPL